MGPAAAAALTAGPVSEDSGVPVLPPNRDGSTRMATMNPNPTRHNAMTILRMTCEHLTPQPRLHHIVLARPGGRGPFLLGRLRGRGGRLCLIALLDFLTAFD